MAVPRLRPIGKRFAGKRQRSCSAKGNNDPWLHESQLLFEPPAIMFDLSSGRSLVNASFAAVLEFEVFDRIREIDAISIDTCIRECPLQQLTGRPNKRPALPILLVTGLFANKCKGRAEGTFAQNGLCRPFHTGGGCADQLVKFCQRCRRRVILSAPTSHDAHSRPNALRNSPFARSRMRNRLLGKFFPPC